MLRKIQLGALTCSIALIGADRIDFFGGHGPFILTPFLIFASLAVLLAGLRSGLRGQWGLAITPSMSRQLPYVAACSMFLLFCFASIPLGLDPERSVVAFCDLLAVAILGYCISVQILEEPGQEALIARAVALGLFVYALFCVGEGIAWTHGLVIDGQRSGTWLENTFAPATLGPWVPMLSGTTFDNNRSGFVLTMYLVLLDRFAPRARYASFLRFAIGFLVLLAVSRSGTLCWLAYYLSSKTFWRRFASRRVVFRLVPVALAMALLGIAFQNELAGIAEAWEISDAVSTKLSMDPGSSGESHILLIRRGFETWLTSPKTVIAGIGVAAAPKVLEDFFGNDKRGNFHCLYVTALAEMGLPAFLLLMFLLCYPMIGRTGSVPAVAAIMIFNVSYQTHTEPVFWLVLALVWSYKRNVPAAVRNLAVIAQPGKAVKLPALSQIKD